LLISFLLFADCLNEPSWLIPVHQRSRDYDAKPRERRPYI
jgi:hypothetical protein